MREDWNVDSFAGKHPAALSICAPGELTGCDPADRINKLAAVAPADTVDCPRWLTFLDETTGKEDELIAFLQRWGGYSLTVISRNMHCCLSTALARTANRHGQCDV